jgi:peptidoglycan hydrolase-like protein with peptidoglycan-binding domain
VSLLESAGRARASLLRHRVIAATAGTATAVLIAGCAYAATSSASGQEKLTAVSENKPATQASTPPKVQAAPVEPLTLVSVSPSGGGHDANGGAPITLTFSSALSPTTALPTLSPSVKGNWQVAGATATFTPSSGYLPGTKVKLKIPGGMTGAAATAGTLGRSSSVTFTTGAYSMLRLQQLLTQLGYLPLNWTASDPAAATVPADSANAQVAAAYNPPAGSFDFKSGYPSELTSQWKAGSSNILVTGAIRAFQWDQGLTMDGDAGPEFWSHLFTAISKDKTNQNGYTYALANQDSPHESLKVWHDGKVILDTPANTGISAAATVDGTFPVYLRYDYQIMKGTNPDGSKYADPVSWVSYFNGGDAVHEFDRASYGWYQSLGCVELPADPAKFVWPYLTYGSLVTVEGPVA